MSARTNNYKVEDAYPLSPLQEGMLFHSVRRPESGEYVTQVTCLLTNLDESAMREAWQQAVARHPILRTAIAWKKLPRPMQVVGHRVQLPFDRHDWRRLPPRRQQERFADFLAEDRRRGFTLGRAPLMRLNLFQISDRNYRFVWSHHHILLDGWSVHSLIREVFAYYAARCRRRQVQLPPCRPYRDYIAWLKQQDLAEAKAYWKKMLQEFTAPTCIGRESADQASLERNNLHGERRVELDAETTASLQDFARRHQLTMNTLVLGAWALLLSRWTAMKDVCFGSVVSGRPAELRDVESMVGLFINTLPVRVAVPPDAELLVWLTKLQQQQAQSRRFEFSSLVDIQQWADVPRDVPLFRTIYAFENYPVQAPESVADVKLQVSDYHVVERVNYPLTFVAGCRERLSLKLLYDFGCLDDGDANRMLGQLQTLLAGMARDPSQRLTQITMLSEAERHQLLVEWNQSQSAYPQRPVHQLFEEQVGKSPDSVASVYGGTHLTYSQLNRHANQLARYLATEGVGRHALVGLCMERSADLLVATLGILKAGGAYLPLDPDYPGDRLAFMLNDAQALLLLTHETLRPGLPHSNAKVVCLDSQWGDLVAAHPSSDLPCQTTAADLAYVMYTSGSTGQPKGIGIPHRAISRLIANTNYIRLRPSDCIAQASNASFDAATFEIWGALLSGARLVGVTKDEAISPSCLAALIREQGINTLFLTTALFNQISREDSSAFAPLKQLLFGGQAVDPRWVRRVLERGAPQRLLHVYGPTESTTFACWQPVAGVSDDARTIAIGRPLANTTCYVLDDRLELVPAGATGELLLGGEGLAWGYLRRAALSAEKFVPHPFAIAPGARLYRTGDLVRWLANGSVEFLGRRDDQVKLRGFRIELGEIEAVLGSHEAVAQVAVTASADESGEKRLVAYVVLARQPGPSASELREFLRRTLPEFMIPGVFMMLPQLPLNANGKIDRRALPAPRHARPDLVDSFVEPRTPVEEGVAGTWAKVLQVDRVGVHDNFFELGGHSLLATQAIARLREAFAVDLPMRCIFESRTLADLARQIESLVTKQPHEEQAIRRVSRDEPLQLSFGQQRLWFLDRLAPGTSAYNSHLGLRLTGPLDVAAVRRTLSEIVRRHEVLRTTFADDGTEPRQVIAPARPQPLAVVDLRALAEPARRYAIKRLGREHSRRPFDLSAGPLLRVTLFRLGDQEHVMLMTMHHVVSDGWTMGIFVREFATYYNAFSVGEPSSLADLSIQYADFAAWQRQKTQDELYESQMAYWKQQLAGLPTLKLPADHPRPPVQTFRGARQARWLDADLCESIRSLSRHEGVTMFMTLLAAFKSLLARYTGQDDIVVGADIANRTRRETENLIGFFANQLVLRTDLSGNPTFRQVLRRVREVAIEAYARQDVSFDKLVEQLQPQRDPSRNPLFQVMFILQNNPVPDMQLSDLTVNVLEPEQETTAFDLTLSWNEAKDGRLLAACRYYADLFEPDTISRLLEQLETLLRGAVKSPDTCVSDLPILAEAELKTRAMEQSKRTKARFDKLSTVQPEKVSLKSEQLVSVSRLESGTTLPLVVRPATEGLDLRLWAQSHRPFIERELGKQGAILFRGFDVRTTRQFEAFTRAICPELMDYTERSSPRHNVDGAVYTSTDHPADQPIVLHNEQSYTLNWMMKLWFYCERPAAQGGRTPIADCRRILNRLNQPVRDRLEQGHIMYMRNYGVGVGLSWREAFQTDDRAAVQRHCDQNSILYEWLDDDRLRTRQIRPAIRRHPHTGEAVWFNHALFFHVTSLEPQTRDSIMTGLDEQDYPFNTYYGDGTPFEPAVLEEIRDAYRQETVSFPWQTDDVLMLDNMLVAHGREPYQGPRQVVVAMAEPFESVVPEDVEAAVAV